MQPTSRAEPSRTPYVLSLEATLPTWPTWLTWPTLVSCPQQIKALSAPCKCASVAIIIAHFCLRQTMCIPIPRTKNRGPRTQDPLPFAFHSWGRADTNNWSLVSPRAIMGANSECHGGAGVGCGAARCSHFSRRFEILMSNYRHVKLNHEIITKSLT